MGWGSVTLPILPGHLNAGQERHRVSSERNDFLCASSKLDPIDGDGCYAEYRGRLIAGPRGSLAANLRGDVCCVMALL